MKDSLEKLLEEGKVEEAAETMLDELEEAVVEPTEDREPEAVSPEISEKEATEELEKVEDIKEPAVKEDDVIEELERAEDVGEVVVKEEEMVEDHLEPEPEVVKAEEEHDDGVAEPVGETKETAEDLAGEVDKLLDEPVVETPLAEEEDTFKTVTESIDSILAMLQEMELGSAAAKPEATVAKEPTEAEPKAEEKEVVGEVKKAEEVKEVIVKEETEEKKEESEDDKKADEEKEPKEESEEEKKEDEKVPEGEDKKEDEEKAEEDKEPEVVKESEEASVEKTESKVKADLEDEHVEKAEEVGEVIVKEDDEFEIDDDEFSELLETLTEEELNFLNDDTLLDEGFISFVKRHVANIKNRSEVASAKSNAKMDQRVLDRANKTLYGKDGYTPEMREKVKKEVEKRRANAIKVATKNYQHNMDSVRVKDKTKESSKNNENKSTQPTTKKEPLLFKEDMSPVVEKEPEVSDPKVEDKACEIKQTVDVEKPAVSEKEVTGEVKEVPEVEEVKVEDRPCEVEQTEEVGEVVVKEDVERMVSLVTEAAAYCKDNGIVATYENICEAVRSLLEEKEPAEKEFNVDAVIKTPEVAEMGTKESEEHIEKAEDEVLPESKPEAKAVKESVQYSSLREACMLDEDYFDVDTMTVDSAESKRTKLQEQLALLIARENNDPMYNELLKEAVYAQRLQSAIYDKYLEEAQCKSLKIFNKGK